MIGSCEKVHNIHKSGLRIAAGISELISVDMISPGEQPQMQPFKSMVRHRNPLLLHKQQMQQKRLKQHKQRKQNSCGLHKQHVLQSLLCSALPPVRQVQ